MQPLRFLTPVALALSLSWSAVAQQPSTVPAVTAGGRTFAVRGHDVFTTIQGNALTSVNAALVGAHVRLRNARSGHIVGTTTTDDVGLFVFRSVDPGTYIAELVDEERVLAASEILNVNAGDTVSAIVQLPFRLTPYAGVLGHGHAAAFIITATAAASGVLATVGVGEPVSPRR
jgi:hypothetical protein